MSLVCCPLTPHKCCGVSLSLSHTHISAHAHICTTRHRLPVVSVVPGLPFCTDRVRDFFLSTWNSYFLKHYLLGLGSFFSGGMSALANASQQRWQDLFLLSPVLTGPCRQTTLKSSGSGSQTVNIFRQSREPCKLCVHLLLLRQFSPHPFFLTPILKRRF